MKLLKHFIVLFSVVINSNLYSQIDSIGLQNFGKQIIISLSESNCLNDSFFVSRDLLIRGIEESQMTDTIKKNRMLKGINSYWNIGLSKYIDTSKYLFAHFRLPSDSNSFDWTNVEFLKIEFFEVNNIFPFKQAHAYLYFKDNDLTYSINLKTIAFISNKWYILEINESSIYIRN